MTRVLHAATSREEAVHRDVLLGEGVIQIVEREAGNRKNWLDRGSNLSDPSRNQSLTVCQGHEECGVTFLILIPAGISWRILRACLLPLLLQDRDTGQRPESHTDQGDVRVLDPSKWQVAQVVGSQKSTSPHLPHRRRSLEVGFAGILVPCLPWSTHRIR